MGHEMALAIAHAGADVILTGRDAASLEKTAADIRHLAHQAVPIPADMGNTSECETACKTALTENGHINILINNVGGRRENIPAQDMPLDTWYKFMDLNLTSAFLCTK